MGLSDTSFPHTQKVSKSELQPLTLGPKKVEAMLLTERFMQHNEEKGGYIKDEANLAGK